MVKKSKKKTKKKIKNKEKLIEEPFKPLKEEKEKFQPEIGPPHLTKYERARIIGARALQVSMSAPILLGETPDIKDPIKIAEMELQNKLLPITVRRKLPDGKYEDIPLMFLLNHGY